MVLICIYLMISDVEQLVLCLLDICMSLWRSVYSSPMPIFLMGLFVFLVLSCRSSINFGYEPLIRCIIGKYVLPLWQIWQSSRTLDTFLPMYWEKLPSLIQFPSGRSVTCHWPYIQNVEEPKKQLATCLMTTISNECK